MTINPSTLFSKDVLNFPVTTKKLGITRYVNLDNAATTPALRVVEKEIFDYLKGYGSVHRGAGTKSKISTTIYDDSKEIIKQFVNAPTDSYVLMTGNTTGAVNTLAYFFSFLKGKVAVSSIEHSSSWLPWIKAEGIKALGKKQVDLVDMDKVNTQIQKFGKKMVLEYAVNEQFEFDLNTIEKLLQNNQIKAFILTASSNITGYCPDIKKIGALVHKYGAYFIVDGCQFVQHHHMDMRDMNVDFLMASGHKFYAPFGGGFLIGPKSFFDDFLPYQIGGGNLPYITNNGEFLRYANQLAHDPGTPNAIGAVSMAIALKKLSEIGLEKIFEHEHKLTKMAFDYLKSNPNIEVYVNEKHLNTVIPFNIKNLPAIDVAERLNSEFGIGVRAGSFCVYQVVRKLLGIKDERGIIESVKKGNTNKIPKIIRASFALCNTEQDVVRFIQAMKELTTHYETNNNKRVASRIKL